MTDFRPWVIPTLFGPFLGAWSIVAALLILVDPGSDAAIRLAELGVPLDTWVLALGIASVVAACLVCWLLLADVTLLSLGSRRLPVGLRAWVTSFFSPLVLFLVSAFAPQSESVLGFALTMAGIFAVTAFGLRWIGGRRFA